MNGRRSGERVGVGGSGGDATVESNGGSNGYGWRCDAAFGGSRWRGGGLFPFLGAAGLRTGNGVTCGKFGSG